MSLFFETSDLFESDDLTNSKKVFEAFLVDDLMHNDSSFIKEFCDSEIANVLQEKAVLKKPTMMRLSKQDDEKRRIKLMAYQMAKDSNDPEWKKLKKYSALRKQSIAKIMKKYGNKAARQAKIAQKNYIKQAKSVKATAQDLKVQNAK